MCEAGYGSPSSIGSLTRASILFLVLIVSRVAQVSPESLKQDTSSTELKALLANAKTAKDHQEIAVYFAQQAQILEKKARNTKPSVPRSPNIPSRQNILPPMTTADSGRSITH